jgi:hypothetical protein
MDNLYNIGSSFGGSIPPSNLPSTNISVGPSPQMDPAIPIQQPIVSAPSQTLGAWHVYRISFGTKAEELHAGIAVVPTSNGSQGVGDFYHLTPNLLSVRVYVPEVLFDFSFERRRYFLMKEWRFVIALTGQRERFHQIAMNTPAPFLNEPVQVSSADWADEVLDKAKIELASF